MDTNSFVVDMVKLLVWPVLIAFGVVGVVIIFRKSLADLISRIKRISHNGTSVEIGMPQSLEELSEKDGEGLCKEADEHVELDDCIEHLVENQPKVAIIEAWSRFEKDARLILGRQSAAVEPESPDELVRMLRAHGVAPGIIGDMAREMARIQQLAVHDPEFQVNSQDARQYAESSLIVITFVASYAGEI